MRSATVGAVDDHAAVATGGRLSRLRLVQWSHRRLPQLDPSHQFFRLHRSCPGNSRAPRSRRSSCAGHVESTVEVPACLVLPRHAPTRSTVVVYAARCAGASGCPSIHPADFVPVAATATPLGPSRRVSALSSRTSYPAPRSPWRTRTPAPNAGPRCAAVSNAALVLYWAYVPRKKPIAVACHSPMAYSPHARVIHCAAQTNSGESRRTLPSDATVASLVPKSTRLRLIGKGISCRLPRRPRAPP